MTCKDQIEQNTILRGDSLVQSGSKIPISLNRVGPGYIVLRSAFRVVTIQLFSNRKLGHIKRDGLRQQPPNGLPRASKAAVSAMTYIQSQLDSVPETYLNRAWYGLP